MNVHNVIKFLICEVCGKSFNEGEFKIHMNTHDKSIDNQVTDGGKTEPIVSTSEKVIQLLNVEKDICTYYRIDSLIFNLMLMNYLQKFAMMNANNLYLTFRILYSLIHSV
jgi:hypothetical protein